MPRHTTYFKEGHCPVIPVHISGSIKSVFITRTIQIYTTHLRKRSFAYKTRVFENHLTKKKYENKVKGIFHVFSDLIPAGKTSINLAIDKNQLLRSAHLFSGKTDKTANEHVSK